MAAMLTMLCAWISQGRKTMVAFIEKRFLKIAFLCFVNDQK